MDAVVIVLGVIAAIAGIVGFAMEHAGDSSGETEKKSE